MQSMSFSQEVVVEQVSLVLVFLVSMPSKVEVVEVLAYRLLEVFGNQYFEAFVARQTCKIDLRQQKHLAGSNQCRPVEGSTWSAVSSKNHLALWRGELVLQAISLAALELAVDKSYYDLTQVLLEVRRLQLGRHIVAGTTLS